MIKQLSLLFVFQFLLGSCLAQSLSGKVVGIMDGDSFKLLTLDSTLVRVRLANIDCPENKQPYSARATKFTAEALFGKMVTISIQKTDRYRRYISNVIYNDSLSLSHELVKNGLAWHYVRYSNDKSLQHLEDRAKAGNIGLWQDPHPIPPWEWRNFKNKRPTKSRTHSTSTSASQAASLEKSISTQCTGKTKSGKGCKRMTKNPNGRCYQH